jgi:sugar/nucleoside kinase (ribokinase family)
VTLTKRAIVAGHICLDIIPGLEDLPAGQFINLLKPGHLINIGEAHLSTGGPVSNTGLALHTLGVPTWLVAKVGEDFFGRAILQILENYDHRLTDGIKVESQAHTSYTVIINSPGMDRIFLHYVGANDAFYTSDIDYRLVAESDLFHFGYPPVMKTMYTSGGRELAKVFRLAKKTGVTTSLDMAFPDPASNAAQVDWREILSAVLPSVDIFAPSIEELLFLLHRPLYANMVKSSGTNDILPEITPELLGELSQELLNFGAKIMLLKLGYRGAYLRTSNSSALQNLGRAFSNNQEEWAEQELWAPCFDVQVVGTTGSGDATISGLLSAILRGYSPRDALTAAVAVGACNVEAPDALSGLKPWDETMQRVASGWMRQPLDLTREGWMLEPESGLWVSPISKRSFQVSDGK